MISEVTLQRTVTTRAENLKTDRCTSYPRGLIMTRLLEDLLSERVSKDHGYYLGVTSLQQICKGEIVEESGDVSFPVVFKCRTFLPCEGEILQGVVYQVLNLGVLLRCGPIKYAYLSALKMPGYRYVSSRKKLGPGRNRRFVSEEHGTIENGVVVCFTVLAVRWEDEIGPVKNEFQMLVSLEGDFLGPISLPGSDDLDL